MKTIAALALVCLCLLSACASTANRQRFGGDPLRELDRNTAGGDYRFRGLMDPAAHRSWVPGVDFARDKPSSQVEYLVTGAGETWTADAERYFTRYNRALAPRRQGRKLDTYGWLQP